MMLRFDKYTCSARIAPALITSLPIIVGSMTVFVKLDYHWKAYGAFTAFILFAVALLGATIARNSGLKAQRKLKEKWGVLPATALLRWRDETINNIIKQSYHQEISRRWHDLHLPSKAEEEVDKTNADLKYEATIERLIQATRDKNQYPGVFRELINFGFIRNLYGLKCLALFIALAVGLVFLANNYLFSGILLTPITALLIFGTIILETLILVFLVNANAVWLVGQRYGRELLKTLTPHKGDNHG